MERTYRVTYFENGFTVAFNIEVRDGANLLDLVLTKLKEKKGWTREAALITLNSIHIITCEGCKIDACGQQDHMGLGGCLY